MSNNSLKSTFNPFNWPDHLRQRKERDPNGNDSARDDHDPHQWADPDPSWRQRLTPDTVGQWLALLAGGLVALGLAVYFYPIFSPAFQNPIALAALFLMAYSIVLYLKGRQDGINCYIDMPKSLLYYGNDFDLRLGEEQGEKGNRQLFTPHTNLSYGGFNERPLLKRDLRYDASKIRSNIKDDAGEEPAVDRLNTTTLRKNIDNFGTVMVTHAADLKHDEFGLYSDRYTPLPNELDEDVVEDVHELIDDLEHKIRTLNQKVDMHEESNEELRQLKQDQTAPQLKETLKLLTMLRGMFHTRGQQGDPAGELEFEDPYDELEEELNQ